MMSRFVDRVRRVERGEQGFYMVWFALTFVALTAFAGLAIEYNRWQQIATRAQKAADAAALAGAVFLPENVGNKAYTTARSISSENGFTNGSNGVTVSTAVGKLPNQLKVTVAINTKNPWGAIVNYNANCLFARPPGNSTGPPWGTFSNTVAGCKITGVSNSGSPNYNGQWVTWQIPIPANYTCKSADPLGCWTKLQFVYPVGTTVSDTTTWSAYILGEPVRLIQ